MGRSSIALAGALGVLVLTGLSLARWQPGADQANHRDLETEVDGSFRVPTRAQLADFRQQTAAARSAQASTVVPVTPADSAPSIVAERDIPQSALSQAALTEAALTQSVIAEPVVGEPGIDQRNAASDSTTDVEYRICRITAYCDRGTTASGVQSGVGQCAAPGDLPFGTRITIPALGRSFIVTDRTHRRFRQSTVDLFMPSCRDCRDFGRRYLEVIIERPKNDRQARQRLAAFR